jgi:hypothetical protein
VVMDEWRPGAFRVLAVILCRGLHKGEGTESVGDATQGRCRWQRKGDE